MYVFVPLVVICLAAIYFLEAFPGVLSDLADPRTMRNVSAHITSTTQTALEDLALRILAVPSPGIDLCSLLTTIDPRSAAGDTVFLSYKKKLIVTAELVAQG